MRQRDKEKRRMDMKRRGAREEAMGSWMNGRASQGEEEE